MLAFVVILGFALVIWRIESMSAELSRLQADVAANTSAVASAVALIEGLAQQIRDNATDPAALAALADSLEADSAKLGAAVATNTPAVDETLDPEEIPPADLEPIEEGSGLTDDAAGDDGVAGAATGTTSEG